MEEKTIKIYPSNWLYNASVIGFLKSVSEIEQYDIEKWFENNIVALPKDIFANLKISDRYFSNDKTNNISSIVGQSSLYRNYINPSRPQDKEGFSDFVKELSIVNEYGQDFCGICSKNFALLPENINKLNEAWTNHGQATEKKKKEETKKLKKTKKSIESKSESNGFEIFFSNLRKYNVAHNNLIAPSTGEFPNAFWNLKDSFSICPLCAYLIIHHHIPFESAKTQNGQIFINAPSFKKMWHLNKYASQMLDRRNSYQFREILGISFMDLAQKVFTTVGAWSMMNIEMVIKGYNHATKQTDIDYYSLPYELSRLLLNKEIANLIGQTKENYIFEIVLSGKVDSLLILNQKILRYSITNSSAFEDKYFSKLNYKDARSLKNLSRILPELYVRINSILKEG